MGGAARPRSGRPPERPAPDSRAAHENTPWAMVDVAASARRVNTVPACLLTPGSSGAASQASSARCPARRRASSSGRSAEAGAGRARRPVDQGQGPVGQGPGPSGQVGQLEGESPLREPA